MSVSEPLSSAQAGLVEALVLPSAVAARSTAPTPRAPWKPGKAEGDEPRVAGMRVPTTAVTIAEWAALRVRMYRSRS